MSRDDGLQLFNRERRRLKSSLRSMVAHGRVQGRVMAHAVYYPVVNSVSGGIACVIGLAVRRASRGDDASVLVLSSNIARFFRPIQDLTRNTTSCNQPWHGRARVQVADSPVEITHLL